MRKSKKPEIVVMVGMPGSGKSTIVERDYPDYEVISLDLINHSRLKEDELLDLYLSQGWSVVVDNTNISRKKREKYFSLAEKYDAKMTACYVDVDIETSLRQNAKRTGKKRVPDSAIYKMFHDLEEPTEEEGFDEVRVFRH